MKMRDFIYNILCPDEQVFTPEVAKVLRLTTPCVIESRRFADWKTGNT